MDIDICIPTFGQAKYLRATLDSLPSTELGVSIFVSDGGSNFDHLLYPMVKWKRLEPDPGLVACWTNAANRGSSDYLAFIADDNCWLPETLELIEAFIKRFPKADIWFARQQFVDADGKEIHQEIQNFDNQFGRNQLTEGYLNSAERLIALEKNSIPLEACVITRKAWEQLGGFSSEAHGALDRHFFAKAIAVGIEIAYDPSYWTIFRFHEQAYSSQSRQEQIRGTHWSLLDARKLADITTQPVFQRLICNSTLNLLRTSLGNLDAWRQAITQFIRSPVTFFKAVMRF
ncbi:glycosyltransferase [Cerasicoccus arenae]|uniref:Glycosyltransferase 2-like domain-containing protein n=1 Tax=Cerasicoccus arenae TaxID=424488 RepID=A0A8J3GCT4_9BACT|nr:glycosyltransferase [Cerasicoccus arenae]MBK1859184.1 glycosyltransferase [Cerasicoccus arenae]GHC01128.1 hypothetical protein GCM10007047_16940 [Cerasicoccus arenae]